MPGGTGTKAEHRLPSGRQDRHHRQLQRRLVRGLHAQARPSSVWVGYPNALREMRSVHGISVAGGTFPASIWHDYMMVAKATTASTFPPAQGAGALLAVLRQELEHGPAATTTATTRATAPDGDNSAGGGNYSGYDPRLYEAPPQQAPRSPAPPGARAGAATPSRRRGRGRRRRRGRRPGRCRRQATISGRPRLTRARPDRGHRAGDRGARRTGWPRWAGDDAAVVRRPAARRHRRSTPSPRASTSSSRPTSRPTSAGRRWPPRCRTWRRWAPSRARPTCRWRFRAASPTERRSSSCAGWRSSPSASGVDDRRRRRGVGADARRDRDRDRLGRPRGASWWDATAPGPATWSA